MKYMVSIIDIENDEEIFCYDPTDCISCTEDLGQISEARRILMYADKHLESAWFTSFYASGGKYCDQD